VSFKGAQRLAHAVSLEDAEVEMQRDEVNVEGRGILLDTDVEPACLLVVKGIKGDKM
jgi:hypothetical protein